MLGKNVCSFRQDLSLTIQANAVVQYSGWKYAMYNLIIYLFLLEFALTCEHYRLNLNFVVPKISLLHPQKVFVLHPPLPLQGIPVWFHTLLLKFWLFRSPLPLGISNDLSWGGYGFFLELHIVKRFQSDMSAFNLLTVANLPYQLS